MFSKMVKKVLVIGIPLELWRLPVSSDFNDVTSE